MIPFLVGAALAAGVHGGIPVHGVAGVGEPTFLTPASGWSARVDGGFVRVFVGASEDAGEDWYARAVSSLGVAPPAFAGLATAADEAAGDGDTLVVFRDGNVGVLVRVDHDARLVADRLHAAIVDDVPAARGPSVSVVDGRWECDAPDAVHLSFRGGRPATARMTVAGSGGIGVHRSFTTPPTELVAWDAWGRPTVLTP
jgi:hypothetical protein